MQKTCNGESYVLSQRKFIVPNPALFFCLKSKTNQKINTLKSSIIKIENVRHDYALQEHNQSTVSYIKIHWKLALCILLYPILHAFNLLLCLLKAIKVIAISCIMIIAVFHSLCLSAQTPRKDSGVNGQVKSELTGVVVSSSDGTPLQGVSVRIEAENLQVKTSKDGRFQLTVSNKSGKIRFSYIGFKSQELSYTAGVSMTVKLITEDNQLDEAMVIAYGTTTRRYATGSVTKVSAKEIEKQPISNPMLALQGLVPGLEVSPNSGINGGSVRLKIRGTASLAQGTEPLVLLNGNPIAVNGQGISQLTNATGPSGLSLFNGINPADIESIEVLKDADATAIYGSRGANGVILITTKKGTSDHLRINFNATNGVSAPSNTMKMMTTAEYLSMRREAFSNSKVTMNETNAPDLLVMDTTQYTDFTKYLAGSTKYSQDWTLGLAGGSDRTSFRVNLGVQKENFQVSDDRFSKRYTFSSNLNHSSKDRKFNMDLSINLSNNESQLPTFDPSVYLTLPPHLQLRNTDGTLNWRVGSSSFSSLGLSNPLGMLEKSYTGRFNNLFGNLSISYAILDDLKLKLSSGYTWGNNNEYSFSPSTSLDPSTVNLPFAQSAIGNNNSWILEPYLTYNKLVDKHSFNGVIGGSAQNSTGQNTVLMGYNFVSDLFIKDIINAGLLIPSNSNFEYKYAAVFGRVNYQYDKKYLLNVSLREDGSSRFGPGKKYALFYSVGLGWIFSDEKIIKSVMPWLTYGKLRGSIGQTGNDGIGNYMYMDTWTGVGSAYNGVTAMQPTKLFNPNYSWERNRKRELALELGVWNNHLLLGASYFHNISDNQLIPYKLPYQTGFTSIIQNWPAKIKNEGYEFTIDSKVLNRDNFSWNIKFNLSVTKNKLIDFPNLETSSYASRYVAGESLSVKRKYKYLGIDPDQGIYMFEDKNGDGVFNTLDQNQLVNLDPKFYGGLMNTISYGQLTVGILFDFRKQKGNSYITSLPNAPGYGLINHPQTMLARWQNNDAEYQRYVAAATDPAYQAAQRFASSDGAIVDASFIKLRNCYINYHLPMRKKTWVQAVDFFLTAQNLLTFTRYEVADPEIQNPFITSPMQTTSLGIKFVF